MSSVMDRFRLDRRVAVLTGGNGLYGRFFARALGEAGAHVVITSRDADTAQDAARRLSADGLAASGYALDLADTDAANTFVARVRDDLGRLDILLNNAVHRQGGDLPDTTADDWTATSQVNSRGLFLLTRAAAAVMGDGGSIVNIGSIYGLVGPDFSLYDGTEMTMPAFYAYDKAGMVGFTRYLACLLGSRGIRVNCLCPGGLYSGSQPDSFTAAYRRRTPLGRMASGEEVAAAAVFLASDAAAYVTGVTLPVDGGWTAR